MVPGVGEDSFKNWICFSKLLLLKHSHASDLRDSLLEVSSLWKNEDSQDRKKRERKKKKGESEVDQRTTQCCLSTRVRGSQSLWAVGQRGKVMVPTLKSVGIPSLIFQEVTVKYV